MELGVKFSVIIPLYNKEHHITKAIKSVLEQNCTASYELLVVDDGSTDNSARVVEDMVKTNGLLRDIADSGKFVFIRQPNGGVSAARNRAIKEAKGDYLCFLDADDWWEQGFLSAIDFLSESYQDATVIGTGRYMVKKSVKKVMDIGMDDNVVHGLVEYESVIEKLGCRPIQTSSVAVKRDVLQKTGMFNPAFKFGEDFDFFYRAYLLGSLALYNKPLSNFNQDVDLQMRGSRPMSLYPQEQSAFFNMNYVYICNTYTVRHFTDYLKLRAFYPYYVRGLYRNEINAQLAGIHWGEHPLWQFVKYKVIPVGLQKAWFGLRVKLSNIKRKLTHR